MRRLFRRLRYWLNPREHDAAFQEELEFHRALKQRELEADGMSSEAARVASSRALGNVTRAREDARAEWIWPWLDSVRQDTRFAVRSLLRQPGFTLLSVIVLGVAIGLNTSLFTVFAGLALRPMAGLTDPDRVVTVSGIYREGGRASGMSYPEFRESRRRIDIAHRTLRHAQHVGQPRSGRQHAIDGHVRGERQLFRSARRPDAARPRIPAR